VEKRKISFTYRDLNPYRPAHSLVTIKADTPITSVSVNGYFQHRQEAVVSVTNRNRGELLGKWHVPRSHPTGYNEDASTRYTELCRTPFCWDQQPTVLIPALRVRQCIALLQKAYV